MNRRLKMKNIKSFFKLLFIYSLVLCLVFSASIKIFALNIDSNEISKNDEIISTDINNNKKSEVQIEENVGKILDKYTGYTDNFEEKINSQDFFEICDIIGAMFSKYSKATEDEQRKFNDYIEKSLKILKNEGNSDSIRELERRYKILSNKDKYVNPNISNYSIEKYPELFENFAKEDLNDIDEAYKLLINVGEILDKYSHNKESYREKIFSIYSKDLLDVITRALDIYEMASEEERYYLDYYISGVLPTLESYYPQRYSPKLKEKYNNLKQNEKSRHDKITSYASKDEKYLVFNVREASKYAHKHHEKYNPEYPDLRDMGGDCANFVSQILRKGGYSPDKKWYIRRKNYKYNIPKNSKELNESWELADPSPWISAKQFNEYWSEIVGGIETDGKVLFGGDPNHLRDNIREGDVVMILKPKFFVLFEGYHTMYVTGVRYIPCGEDCVGKNEYLMTYHSSDKEDESLEEVVKLFMAQDNTIRVKLIKTGPDAQIMSN
jgi:hypothetical protein